MPLSVAFRNKLKNLPTDEDEPSYAGVSGMKLSVVGQCHMYICFKEMKTTKDVRAIVVFDEGGEILIGMETLITWGIIPECFPLPMNINDRVGAARDTVPSFVRKVKETEHTHEKLVDIKERVGSWRIGIKFNQVTKEKFEKYHEIEVFDHLKKKLLKQFADIFKEDLELSDRLDVPPVKIPLKPIMRACPSIMPEFISLLLVTWREQQTRSWPGS